MRILIADDHDIVLKGLKQILVEEFPLADITEVSTSDGLLKHAIKGNWEIVIMDLSMPGRSSIDVLREIKISLPELKVLVLTMYPEESYALKCFKAGASGYLNKNLASEELIKAIKRILSGRKYITSNVAEKLLDALEKDDEKAPHELLSSREFDVLKLLAKGVSVSAIAETLGLSPTTVSTYRIRLLDKMNMKTNAELTIYAKDHHLL